MKRVCSRCGNLRSDFEVGIKTCNRCRKQKAAYLKTDTGKKMQSKASKKYLGTEKGKACYNKSSRKMRRLKPWLNSVYSKVEYAVKTGNLVRGVCEVCGSVRVQAHHDDYSKPLNIRWFCVKHHQQYHRKELYSLQNNKER